MNAMAPIRLPDVSEIDETFKPRSEAEFLWACQSWRWRIYSGWLYKIIVKSEDPDDPGLVQPFIPNDVQREILENLSFRNCIVKARQLGCTTLIAILWLDHALWHENQRVGIIAHNLEDAAIIFRDKVRFAYDQLPEFLRERLPLKTANKSELVFAHNNSSVRVSTSMRSGTIHRLHVCLSGDTEILLKGGRTKPIREIEPGDLVMTDRGSYLPAVRLVQNRIEDVGEPLLALDVHGWHTPLKITANHRVLTREHATGKPVWREAGDLAPGDYIAFPLREMSMKLRDGALPWGPQEYAKDSAGKRAPNCGRKIPVTHDLGVLVGMYLAEGHIRRTETTFALHRGDEVAWFCDLLRRFDGYFDSFRVYDTPTSLTTQVVVNGRDFADFFTGFFGQDADKAIPDAVWAYGKDFVDGLIWGYFQGDGCFKNVREVQVTSVRPQLIHQMRMLLIARRIGVSSIYFRPAGQYYGRNCKASWVLKMHGSANWKFREKFGLDLPEITSKRGVGKLLRGADPTGRKHWRRGKDHYWLRITNIEIAPDEPFVYDIVLPKEPHSYVTVCGVVHNSEMGKIAAKYPDKATEVVTGSLPAVPKDGIAIIESTAEGQSGEFYKIAKRAQEVHEAGDWTPDKWRFHFYPWWTDKAYVANPAHIRFTDDDHAYFDKVEHETGTLLTMAQRAWYVSKRDEEFGGDPAKMWQEMPSTPDEAWQQSTEGRYYARQLAMARVAGRIREFDHNPEYPCLGFWDIGQRDGTGLWLMQKVENERRFLRYIENWGAGFSTTIDEAVATGFRITQMYLPHDADHKRQTKHGVIAASHILRELMPSWDWIVLDPVANLETGIELTRRHFSKAVFHPVGCREGLIHLGNYQRRWNSAVGFWAPEPLKNEATEAADSFRQWAQAEEAGLFQETKQRTRYASARVL